MFSYFEHIILSSYIIVAYIIIGMNYLVPYFYAFDCHLKHYFMFPILPFDLSLLNNLESLFIKDFTFLYKDF